MCNDNVWLCADVRVNNLGVWQFGGQAMQLPATAALLQCCMLCILTTYYFWQATTREV